MLRAAYHVLARRVPCRDLGADCFDERHRDRVTHRAVHALELQGYRVSLAPAARSASRWPGDFPSSRLCPLRP